MPDNRRADRDLAGNRRGLADDVPDMGNRDERGHTNNAAVREGEATGVLRAAAGRLQCGTGADSGPEGNAERGHTVRGKLRGAGIHSQTGTEDKSILDDAVRMVDADNGHKRLYHPRCPIPDGHGHLANNGRGDALYDDLFHDTVPIHERFPGGPDTERPAAIHRRGFGPAASAGTDRFPAAPERGDGIRSADNLRAGQRGGDAGTTIDGGAVFREEGVRLDNGGGDVHQCAAGITSADIYRLDIRHPRELHDCLHDVCNTALLRHAGTDGAAPAGGAGAGE